MVVVYIRNPAPRMMRKTRNFKANMRSSQSLEKIEELLGWLALLVATTFSSSSASTLLRVRLLRLGFDGEATTVADGWKSSSSSS